LKKHKNLRIYDQFITVDCGDGASHAIVNAANEDDHIEWLQRYGSTELREKHRLAVAFLLESYDYLLSDRITQREAIERLRILRRARAELFNAEADRTEPARFGQEPCCHERSVQEQARTGANVGRDGQDPSDATDGPVLPNVPARPFPDNGGARQQEAREEKQNEL